MILHELFEASPGGSDNYAENLAQKVFNVRPNLRSEDDVLNIGYKVAVQDLASQTRAVSLFSRDQDFPSDFVSAYYYLQKQKTGVAEDQLNELDFFAPVTTFIKMTDGSYIQADWRKSQGNPGLSDSASFVNFKPVNPNVAKQLGLDSHQRNNSISNHRDGTIVPGGPVQGSGPLANRGYEVVDYNKPETMEELPPEIKSELVKWVQKQGVAEGWDKLTPQQKAHEYNLDASQREMDRRHAQGEDMTGAKIDKKTYKIVKPKQQGVAEDSHKNSQAYRADGGANDENHESDQRREKIEKSGTWYIRLNGKLIKDKQGNPYSFRGKAAANKAALTMQAKLFNQGKEFMLTTNPNDKTQGVVEGSLEANTPNPVVVVQDLKGKILDKVNLSMAVQKYKLGNPQDIKNQLAHQNYTQIGNYVIVSPMSGQPQDATTQGVAEGFNGEYDDEAGMADNNLETLKRAVQGIDDVIQAGDNLPEWCQEKIAVSKSMLVSVWDYMRSEKEKN